MRHHVRTRTLHRPKRQRTALLRSLARSLVLHEAITTTEAKAKELRPFVERLITASKKNTVASRREVSRRLGGAPEVVQKLHGTLAERYGKRPGGYTRITRLGRTGKRAIETVKIELV